MFKNVTFIKMNIYNEGYKSKNAKSKIAEKLYFDQS